MEVPEMNITKTFAVLSVAAVAFAGCSSYSEIAKWNSNATINDGEVPVASFVTQNFSYQLLWCIPLCSGVPWTEGAGDDWIVDEYNVSLFADEATIDGNRASLNHALDLVGSHRISQLKTVEDDSKAWSLFLINRHEVRTQCLILPERK
jgi:hypothetical protein